MLDDILGLADAIAEAISSVFWEVVDWLIGALADLLFFLFELFLLLVEGALSLLPASGPGLPGADMPGVDLAWVGAVVDFGAIGELVVFVALIEVSINSVGMMRWLWGWIKW